MREITVAEAIREALTEEMERDETVFVFGEDVGIFGGDFGVTQGLHKKFPDRIIDTPIAELGIMGIALGSAYSGMRPVPEIMFSDFTTVCFDYFVNQVSKTAICPGCRKAARMLV